MTSLIKPCLLAGCLFLISGNVFAQSAEDISELEQVQVESENASDDNAESVVVLNENVESEDDLLSDDLDDMFNYSSDTEAIITAPPAQENDSISKKGIVLTGNLASRLGGYIYFYPFDLAPGATFESTVSFASRPNDYFSIHGSLLVSFPQMQIGLYELYINYNLWNYAYIMAGKKDVHWGNARIFDTNVLDDKNNNPDEHDPEKLLYENADTCVRIPMIDDARSLNLSNSVAIGVYEVLRQWNYPKLLESGELRNYNWADLK